MTAAAPRSSSPETDVDDTFGSEGRVLCVCMRRREVSLPGLGRGGSCEGAEPRTSVPNRQKRRLCLFIFLLFIYSRMSRCSSVINSTPPFNYSARLPRSGSGRQLHQASRRRRSAVRSLTPALNRKMVARDGGEEGAAAGTRGGGSCCLLPRHAPLPGRVPRPNHSLLNNSACSSAVI